MIHFIKAKSLSFNEANMTLHEISLCFTKATEGVVVARSEELLFRNLTASEYCGGAAWIYSSSSLSSYTEALCALALFPSSFTKDDGDGFCFLGVEGTSAPFVEEDDMLEDTLSCDLLVGTPPALSLSSAVCSFP